MVIFLYVRQYLFKLVNAILGKTPFFIELLGWFLLITGFIFLSSLHRARAKLSGMFAGQMKCLLCAAGILLVMGGCRIMKALQLPGSGLFSVFLFFCLVIWYYVSRKQINGCMRAMVDRIPDPWIKKFIWVQILIGIVMVMFHRRFFW